MGFLDSSGGGDTYFSSFCDRCFLGCFPPFTGALRDVDLGVVFLLG